MLTHSLQHLNALSICYEIAHLNIIITLFEPFISSKFLDMLTCYTNKITTNETCTSTDIYDSIMMNLKNWPHTICPGKQHYNM